jgi:hypothetical protein
MEVNDRRAARGGNGSGGNDPDARAQTTDEPVQMPSDQPSNEQVAIAVPSAGEVAEPIIVDNTLWSSANPQAYGGGAPSQITHLRELELADKSDNGRWGALDVIPTKADYVLDLIRLNSLWPLLSGLACCAIEMMSAATPMRWPGRCCGCGSRCRNQSGASRWATAPARAAATSARTRRSKASTGSCPSTSTCPAARRGRKA